MAAIGMEVSVDFIQDKDAINRPSRTSAQQGAGISFENNAGQNMNKGHGKIQTLSIHRME